MRKWSDSADPKVVSAECGGSTADSPGQPRAVVYLLALQNGNRSWSSVKLYYKQCQAWEILKLKCCSSFQRRLLLEAFFL